MTYRLTPLLGTVALVGAFESFVSNLNFDVICGSILDNMTFKESTFYGLSESVTLNADTAIVFEKIRRE